MSVMIMCFSKAQGESLTKTAGNIWWGNGFYKFKLFKVFGYLVQSSGIFIIIELKIRLIAVGKYC